MKHEALYTVTAQVIPLLFIAAAIEARFFSDKALIGFMYSPIQDAFFRLMLIAMMTWGEVESLVTLANGHEDKNTMTAVLFALVAGAIVVVGPMVRAQMDAMVKEHKTVGMWTGLAAIAAIAVFLIILYAT